MDMTSGDAFYREYTSQDAILKYTRATAGFGISYLLNHDYKAVYDRALSLLPHDVKNSGIRMLEFGCGGGMNLVHLASVLDQNGLRVGRAIGTDFSPVLIEAAKREAKNYLKAEQGRKVEFYVAKNESLIDDLVLATGSEASRLKGSFHFICGVNTIRYSHRAKKELECAKDLADLLAPGGVCVIIDMNDRFLFFRSAVKNRLLGRVEAEECALPSLGEYTEPFRHVGLTVLRSEHFCWIPHSSGPLMCYVMGGLSPILNVVARSRSMRSLVVAQKPIVRGKG